MIDAISLILKALEAGNAPDVGVQALIPDDYRFAYSDFTELVAGKLLSAGGPTLLENYMAQPDLYESALAEALEEAGAGSDGALIESAQEFMMLMDVRGAARGKYTVDIDEEAEGFV